MKISAITGTGTPAGAVLSEGRMPQDRINAAKAIARGEAPIKVEKSDTPVDPQVERAERSVRRIKMKTQVSPDRFDPNTVMEVGEGGTPPVAESAQPSAISDTVEQDKKVSEETKPLSPVLAEIARQRRALQVKERELAERESKITPPNLDEYVSKADLIANPLKVFDVGVTYDQLTEAILNNQNGNNPEIQKLREELKALKEGVDKTLSEKDQQAEKQVLAEMTREANQIVAQGDDYELIREQGYVPKVIDLIHRTWKQSGEILDVTTALGLVEDELIKDALKVAQLKKVQTRLTPAQAVQQQQQTQQKTMRTLTNRDGASVPPSRRERAIAAFYGQLRK